MISGQLRPTYSSHYALDARLAGSAVVNGVLAFPLLRATTLTRHLRACRCPTPRRQTRKAENRMHHQSALSLPGVGPQRLKDSNVLDASLPHAARPRMRRRNTSPRCLVITWLRRRVNRPVGRRCPARARSDYLDFAPRSQLPRGPCVLLHAMTGQEVCAASPVHVGLVND